MIESSSSIVFLRLGHRGDGSSLLGDLLIAWCRGLGVVNSLDVAMRVICCSSVLSAWVKLARLVVVGARDLPRRRPRLVSVGDWSGRRQFAVQRAVQYNLQIHERKRVAMVDMTSPGLSAEGRATPSQRYSRERTAEGRFTYAAPL